MKNIAVVGATGNVGREILEILPESNLKINKIFPIASNKSAGSKVEYNGKSLEVIGIDDFDFSQVDIAFFSAGSKVSDVYARKAADNNCVVIDNTPCFRRDVKVPLVVPEVNAAEISDMQKNIIANPNCAAIQIAVAVNEVHKIFGIKNLVISTYQAVSGAGNAAVAELKNQINDFSKDIELKTEFFPKQIHANVIPQIDVFLDNGNTGEEDKVIYELKKIIDKDINVVATCARVPVFNGHAASVYIECEKEFNKAPLEDAFKNAPGIVYTDNFEYITQTEASGKNEVFVSRLRGVDSNKKAIQMWIVADNLRKGAAFNSIQIAELL